jgi:hypothetical protein
MITGAGKKGSFIPGWFWILFIGVPICILTRWFCWWFFSPSYKRTSSVEIDTPRADSIKLPVKKDDFRKLKGIGPKISDALHKVGILTYEQLGLLDPEKLDRILKSENVPSANAGFWQAQAKLTAAEDWKKLEALQSK